jgi:hypothetical protein
LQALFYFYFKKFIRQKKTRISAGLWVIESYLVFQTGFPFSHSHHPAAGFAVL